MGEDDLEPLDHTSRPKDVQDDSFRINLDVDFYQSIETRPKRTKKSIPDYTERFINTLYKPLPNDTSVFDNIQLSNIHIYGGPGSGKTTTARSIGEIIMYHYGEEITQCIESSYVPEAIEAMDPEFSVFVLSIDDPMREQDARKPSDPIVQEACNDFFEIRHIFHRKKTRYNLKKYLDVDKLSKIDEVLIAEEKWSMLAKKYPKELFRVRALIYTIFGPQVPQIDQRLHTAKIWEIYKAYGSLDLARKNLLEQQLGDGFFIFKLGENEKKWRSEGKIEFMSRSLVKDPFTKKDIGWLWLTPPEENVFESVERGEKRHRRHIETETDMLDEWAQYIFQERKFLSPPYIPHDRIHSKQSAIRNFIRDVQRSNIDPRTNERLSAQEQVFLRKTANLVKLLEDRISKIYASQSDEVKIEAIAEALIKKAEEDDLNPYQKRSQALFRALSHKIDVTDRDLLRKSGVWVRIFDEIIYQWTKKHGVPSKKKKEEQPIDEGAIRIPIIREQMKKKMEDEGDIAVFDISLDDIISNLLDERPDLMNNASIYCHLFSYCDYDHMTYKEMSLNSEELFGEFLNIEQLRYRKKQFEGNLSQKLGDMFEIWLEVILNQGYEIPGVLEDVELAERKAGHGQPDIILTHKDGKQSVVAAKCYNSQRSESFEKAEFNPEIKYFNRLLRLKGKLFFIYRNIGINDMLVCKVFNSSDEIPKNVFFSPKDEKIVFRRGDRVDDVET